MSEELKEKKKKIGYMAICLIGNGVYRIDPCTAVITSDGSPGVQKFNFPTTNFRVYTLKKESGCGFIGSGTAILYYKPPDYSGDWIELTRANTASGEGSVWVWFDIVNPGDKFWKIVWGDCTKEFVSGNPASLRLNGTSWIIGDGWSAGLCANRPTYGKGDAIIIEGGIQASTTGMYDEYSKLYVTCISLVKEFTINGNILKLGYLSASEIVINIYRPYSGINAIQLRVIGNGEKEVDISRFGSGSITVYVELNKGSPTPFTETFSVRNIVMCNTNWQCEQPLNGYESDISGCISGVLGLEKRRANSICNPCIPVWRCKMPYDGTEIDGCGNSRINQTCSPDLGDGNNIKNGGFDTNLDGWNKYSKTSGFTGWYCCWNYYAGSGEADAIWDNGRVRLRVLKCAIIQLSQTFTITGKPLTFDWQTSQEGIGEPIGYSLMVEGSVVKSEGIPNTGVGTITIDTAPYIGKQATITFYIGGELSYGGAYGPYYVDGYCGFNDHGNSYLWIDNVKMPCTRNWQCEPGQTGYEFSGCGNERRSNLICYPCSTPTCNLVVM